MTCHRKFIGYIFIRNMVALLVTVDSVGQWQWPINALDRATGFSFHFNTLQVMHTNSKTNIIYVFRVTLSHTAQLSIYIVNSRCRCYYHLSQFPRGYRSEKLFLSSFYFLLLQNYFFDFATRLFCFCLFFFFFFHFFFGFSLFHFSVNLNDQAHFRSEYAHTARALKHTHSRSLIEHQIIIIFVIVISKSISRYSGRINWRTL